jgi:four helix bundle protein
MDDRKIKSFTDLKAWRSSHRLSISIYRITEEFPKNEQFGLCSQMKRATVSVTSNIAEGFGRATPADKEHFYIMASGSLYEIKSQLILAKDLGFINNEAFQKIAEEANAAHRLLNGLLKAHKLSKGSSNV